VSFGRNLLANGDFIFTISNIQDNVVEWKGNVTTANGTTPDNVREIADKILSAMISDGLLPSTPAGEGH